MQPRQAVFVGLMVSLCVGLGLAPAVGATSPVAPPTSGNGTASMGAQLSSFMQANSADANGTVDTGMWRASFNRSGDKNRSVAARLSTLERRLARLHTRMDRLEAQRDKLPEGVYLARASRLSAEIETIERTLNETESVASTVGVNATRLDRLRSAARNASDHETAETARTVTVVDARARRGPPDRATRQNESGRPALPSPSVDAAGSGVPEGDYADPSVSSAPGTAIGPPDDVGSGGSDGPSNASRDDPGNGNGPASDVPGNSSARVPGT